MLSSTLQAHSYAAHQSVNRIGAGARDLSQVAYVVTDDELLGQEVSSIIQSQGVRTQLFRSAAAYLGCKHPDVASCLFIGRSLSDMSGLDLQRTLAYTVAPPIIFLSDDGDIPSCVRAIKEGAHDFLTLPVISSHLLMVMQSAFKREQVALALRREEEDLRNRWRSLTSREAEVMRYVVGGFLNKQTAYELRITENTVQVHRGRAMRKMRADSFASLVCMSLRLAEHGENALLRTSGEQRPEDKRAFIRDGVSMPIQWGELNPA
ncbi:response regulator transcription factor [Acidicapsa ligni]|uniref:response regulator transcription factor n=1 Tax=Acidicapsa ligni TaxID=542300 RepID=UPI0021E042DE|nr:LuxR C-terminal-related transcriptional regulator [Acidicapsa ligni]